ncbi:methylmalonyl Co-A mutase-associated GTPase MeaB [Hwanghaeella sp.]|uniref:methylmalonyl Co-A mutase-associated GTPase MeaB n=1 Tax=Hwanghaeella sp. TaxID=2605943 RepID=UPI003CCC21E9
MTQQQVNVSALADGVAAGDRRSLARAITLVESTRADHRAAAEELLERLMPSTGKSIRVGISGVPGVGKSSFIESFGEQVTGKGHKLAVLAVDPSSKRSGGSILGDKTRMEALSRNRSAFIRPSPAGATLGGVARRTREAMLVCEAAGFDVILVETVGVGQSETAVAEMTDMFLLLLLPGGGDELQGLKKGIVELADMILVNKADGDLIDTAKRSVAEYTSALRMLRPASPNWNVPVLSCSARTGDGIEEAWQKIEAFREALGGSGEIARRRSAQALDWLWTEVGEGLIAALKAHPAIVADLPDVERKVADGALPPTIAARRLIGLFARS